jgi:SAM-dependent methyltransferase|tara:strand:- start:2925 stop:3965 length:1041 start_codon:yes stop_codon:yes gene_type:complete
MKNKKTLSEKYSMSDTLTCKEMWSKVEGYNEISLNVYKSRIKYINQFTGKVKDEHIEYVHKCPVCTNSNYKYLFTKDGFDHMRCNNSECQTIFVHQILTEDGRKMFHKGEIYYPGFAEEGGNYGKTKTEGTLSEMDRLKFSLSMDKVLENSELDIKDIFDFGSAAGTFVEWGKEQGYNIIGQEYHKGLREFCQSRDLNVVGDDLETIKFDKKFDLITCWDYIDHIHHPQTVINNLSKYLKDGGLFFFAINNIDSLAVKIMHQHSPTFIGSHHPVHYGIKNLNYLMGDNFKLLHSESYVSELNWISNWCNWDNPEIGDSPLMHNIFKAKDICSNGLGFKLNAVYKKQ